MGIHKAEWRGNLQAERTSEGEAAGMRMRDNDKLSLGCEVSKDGLFERDIERKEQFS